MPSINMIAPRRAEKQRLLRDIRRLTLVISLELIVIVLMSGWMLARVYTIKNHIADMDDDILKLQPVVRKIESFENATKELEPKVDLLVDARTSTMRWYGLLDNLSTSMPKSTWITRLATAPAPPEAKEAQISLNGVSASQELVGEAMLRLHSNPDICNVDLHFTQRALLGNKDAVEFEVAAVLRTAETDKPEKGANKGVVAKS